MIFLAHAALLLLDEVDEEEQEDEADGGAGTNAGLVNAADGGGDDGALAAQWRWSIMLRYYIRIFLLYCEINTYAV